MRTPEEFWANVKLVPSGCMEWQGGCTSAGYGCLVWNGQICVAHRVAAWLVGLVDQIAAPKNRKGDGFVLHKCDNRRCCNPEHFFIGTFTDNMLDAYSKKRKFQPRGSNHVNSKLTPQQVIDIREEYALGARQVDLAAIFGVSQVAISLIVRNKTYVV